MGQPIAYNSTGGISGSIQAGKLSYAVETEGRDYTSYLSKKWVNSVEPKTGSYVFVTDSFTQGKTTEGNAYPLFYATPSTSSADVTAIASGLPGITASFETANEALEAIAASGKYLILDAKEPYESIDTDGLVLNLDASKLSSYQGGDDFYNLSTSPTMSLVNAPLDKDKYIRFNGTNEYGEIQHGDLDYDRSLFAVEGIARQYGTIVSYRTGFFNKWNTGGGRDNEFSLNMARGERGEFTGGFIVQDPLGTGGENNRGAYTVSGSTYNLSGSNAPFVHIVGVFNNGTGSYYRNGVLEGEVNFGFTTVKTISNLPFQTANFNISHAYPSLMDVAKLRMYSGRALTETDVKQNYYGGNIVTDGLIFALDASKLVSYESGSTTAYSMTGSESGSLVNGVGFDKEYGGSFTFDGTDDYINGFDGVSINTTSSFSVEFWYNLTSYSDSYPALIQLKTNTANGWNLSLNTNSSTYRGILFGSSNSDWVNLKTDIAPPTGVWNHVVVTYNGNGASTSSNYKVYLNNINQPLVGTGGFNPTTQNNYIGTTNANDRGIDDFYGNISISRIYNRALTAEEVTQNYNATKQRYVK